MARTRRSQVGFGDALDSLLEERDMTQRGLARALGITQGYISRAKNSVRYPSMRLLEESARALDLPEDYFPEYRELAVIEAVRRDPVVRDRFYDQLRRSRKK